MFKDIINELKEDFSVRRKRSVAGSNVKDTELQYIIQELASLQV